MDKNKIIAVATGLVIGNIIGYFIAISVIKNYHACDVLKQENKMLMDMIMQQQETIIIQEEAIPDSLEWYEQ